MSLREEDPRLAGCGFYRQSLQSTLRLYVTVHASIPLLLYALVALIKVGVFDGIWHLADLGWPLGCLRLGCTRCLFGGGLIRTSLPLFLLQKAFKAFLLTPVWQGADFISSRRDFVDPNILLVSIMCWGERQVFGITSSSLKCYHSSKYSLHGRIYLLQNLYVCVWVVRKSSLRRDRSWNLLESGMHSHQTTRVVPPRVWRSE